MSSDERWRLDGHSQAELVRNGAVPPDHFAHLAAERIAALDDGINSVVTRLFDRIDADHIAADIGRGAPFAGVPILLKDAGEELDGTTYGCGLKLLHEHGHVSIRTTPFTARLLHLGFVIIGKAASSELATGNTTEPPGLAPTRNPWDRTRTAGGSSGGSAAAVAAGLVPIAHGTDHTGSLRYPAAACGVLTLKPTAGRFPALALGDVETPFAANTNFVMTRSVRDLAGVLGEAPTSPTEQIVRLLVTDPTMALPLDPACIHAVRRAGAIAEANGHAVEEIELPEMGALTRELDDFGIITGHLRAATVAWLERVVGRPLVEGDLSEPLLSAGRNGADVTYSQATEASARIGDALGPLVERLRSVDVLITPALRQPAWPLGPASGPADSGVFPVPFSITGHPAMSVPLEHDAHRDLPIGVQLVGRHRRDADLLGFAAELELASPWDTRWPPEAVEEDGTAGNRDLPIRRVGRMRGGGSC